MSVLTLHGPNGIRLGEPLTVYGDANEHAERIARTRPGYTVIVWKDGFPSNSWSFPKLEKVSV